MSLSASGMKSLIKSKIEAISDFPDGGISPTFADDRVLQALCEGIVEHIQGNAVVSTTGSDPQGGIVSSTGTVS